MQKYFLNLINFLYYLTDSKPLTIILLALILKLVFMPFSIPQVKFRKFIQPEIKDFNSSGKSREEIFKLTMEVYKKYEVSIFSIFIPIIIQLFVMFLSFRALNSDDFSKIGGSILFWNLNERDPYYVFPVLNAIFTLLFGLYSSQDQNRSLSSFVLPFAMMIVFGNYWTISFHLFSISFSLFSAIQDSIVGRLISKKYNE
jgi:YidC/Oxa1 family membrane protein insertase